MVPVGEGLLGRAIDSLGRSLDGKVIPKLTDSCQLMGKINFARKPIDTRLDVGVGYNCQSLVRPAVRDNCWLGCW